MSWRAIFLDGPLHGKGHDRMFMGTPQTVLRFMPLPAELGLRAWGGDGWVLCGMAEWDDNWPDQVTYVRDESRSQLLEMPPGEDEGWAAYRLAEMTEEDT